MKYFFTLLFVLVFVSFNHAQESPSIPSPANWNSPMAIFQAKILKTSQVSMIRMQSIGKAALRGGGTYPYQEVKIYKVDPQGQIVKLTEIEGMDTVRISSYKYTENGLRNWENVDDRSWNKRYKTGCRFNSDDKIYQMKSYEMINEEEEMLLDTRNYVYDAEGKLQAIRFMELNRLVKRHSYVYDRDNRMTGIFVTTADGSPLQSTLYTYDSQGRPSLVSYQNPVEGSQHEYMYLYQHHKLSEIHWKENGTLKGKAVYLYDAEGQLIEMRTEMTPGLGENELHTVFEYAYSDYY